MKSLLLGELFVWELKVSVFIVPLEFIFLKIVACNRRRNAKVQKQLLI